ncbi:MAG: metal ABC transporter substrate-binding protein [Bellilinea sp.]
MHPRYLILPALLLLVLLTACQPSAVTPAGEMKVVATTSIVADVVQQIGGDAFTVSTLLLPNAEPHNFQPSPRDMAMVENASIIFANGAGLEEFLQPLIENAGAKARVIEVSDGIQLLEAPVEESNDGEPHTGDPHTWVDPNNVMVWVENIRAALVELDPANAAIYQANAARYTASLQELDSWVAEQVALIPAANRTLVTDHLVYGYFAARYGFEQIGAIIPGFSTSSSPSAQDLAQIEEAIRGRHVRAIFVSDAVTPTLAQRVSDDTGVQLVRLYHESFSEPGGPAATYLDMIHYNVNAMVAALKP